MKIAKTGGNSKEINAYLLELARKKGGMLNAEDVVRAARHEDSPLHHRFTWDDSEAAENWRYWQARAILSIAVDIIDVGNKQRTVRAFVSLRSDRKESGYRIMSDVLSDKRLRDELIQDSLDQMSHFRQRFSTLQELTRVFSEMAKVELKLRKKVQIK